MAQRPSNSELDLGRLYDHGSIARLKDLKLPPSVYTIAATAGFYFLSEVGINSVLTVYLIELLQFEPNVAVSIVMIYRCLTSNMSIVVAFLADNFFGRFTTLVTGSIIYLSSVVVFSFMSVPFLYSASWMIYIALVLRGIGSSCLLASLVPFANDQMKMRTIIPPRNVLTFYFFIVWVSSFLDFFSVILSTFLKQGFHCFGRDNCYPASFAYCAVNSILGFSVFLLGMSYYVMVKPVKAVTAKAPLVIFYALRARRKHKTRKEAHWLDYAKDKYDPVYVDELKEVIKVILSQMFLFWTLLHQRYTLWTLQAMRLSRRLGDIHISPEQVVAMYPFFVIILSPAYFFLGRPLLTRFIKAPLMQMTLAGVLISCAFTYSAILTAIVELDEISKLETSSVRITFVNGQNSTLDVENGYDLNTSMEPYSFRSFVLDREKSESTQFKLSSGDESSSHRIETRSDKYDYYYYISDPGRIEELPNFKQLKDNSPVGVILYCICVDSMRDQEVILAVSHCGGKQSFEICSSKSGPDLSVVPGENYAIFLNGTQVGSVMLDYGDAMILLVHRNNDTQLRDDSSPMRLSRLTVLNSRRLSFLWIIPQYLLLSISAIIFMLAVFVFQYNETPPSCTALIWSLKHFNSGIDSFAMATSSLLISLSMVLGIWSIASFLYTLTFGLLTKNYHYRASSDISSPAVRVKKSLRTFMYN